MMPRKTLAGLLQAAGRDGFNEAGAMMPRKTQRRWNVQVSANLLQ